MIHFGYLSEGKITLCMPTKRVLDTTATITSSFHWYLRRSQLISLRVSFLSRVDELHDLLASSPCMGLHSSAGRALRPTADKEPEKLWARDWLEASLGGWTPGLPVSQRTFPGKAGYELEHGRLGGGFSKHQNIR